MSARLDHVRTCPLCEAMCGLRVQVEKGRVARIRGNQSDVWSRGYLCPKGTALGELHPDDARRLGLEDGKCARVSSPAGSLTVPVEVSEEMKPRVVCLPHGWVHDKPGAQLSVAAEHAGACNNVLAPGTLVDVPSGNAVVNGIPVEVAPA